MIVNWNVTRIPNGFNVLFKFYSVPGRIKNGIENASLATTLNQLLDLTSSDGTSMFMGCLDC